MARKLTLEEVKSKLKIINSSIEITDTEYIGNKVPLECHCLICDTVWKMNWNNLSSNHGCPNCYYKTKLVSEEDIIKCVLDSGYEFISFISKGLSDDYKLKVKCPENHTYTVKYRTFQNGNRCKKCGYKKIGDAKRKDVNEVLGFIHDNGYSIVGELDYKDNKNEFTIMCTNGHLRKTCYNYLTQTPNCPECNPSYRKPYTKDEVIKILADLEMEFLDGDFINSHTPFKYRCTCGNISYARLYSILEGKKCRDCSGSKKYTIDELKSIYESYDCELISTEYKNNHKKLEFKCSCGRIGYKILNDYLNSPQCQQCGVEKRSGENHPWWNPNLTNDERMKNRKFKEYEHWRITVYERDNYTCQCCGDNKGGNLNAHHLDSHDWAKDKRIDIDNGITLCELCHTDFHNLYGYGDNTKEQFEEYMNDLLNNAI